MTRHAIRPRRVANRRLYRAAMERGDYAQAIGYLMQSRARFYFGATRDDVEVARRSPRLEFDAYWRALHPPRTCPPLPDFEE